MKFKKWCISCPVADLKMFRGREASVLGSWILYGNVILHIHSVKCNQTEQNVTFSGIKTNLITFREISNNPIFIQNKNAFQ